MMADCAAMSVDAITYLFNYAAERIKNHRIPKEDKLLDHELVQRQRRMQRLLLELIPPLVSVTTLLAVTILSMSQAIDVLTSEGDITDPPDIFIMSVFSLLNLVLDGVNVSCFARAEHQLVRLPSSLLVNGNGEGENEESHLTGTLKKGDNAGDSTTYSGFSQEADMDNATLALGDDNDDQSSSSSSHLNLNMCSAWTVSARLLMWNNLLEDTLV
jgi:hypothetical protein